MATETSTQLLKCVTETLQQYTEAVAVIEWLVQNHLMPKTTNPRFVAYQYAVDFTQLEVRDHVIHALLNTKELS